MKYLRKTIYEDDFDLKSEIKKHNVSFRELGKITGINFAHLNKIANGLVTTEDSVKKIREAMFSVTNKE